MRKNITASSFEEPSNAFTLAEVLITLVVIGVVAALTLPRLYDNYQKMITAERVKLAYTTLENALRHAEATYGPRANWNWDANIGPVDAVTYMDLNYIKKCQGGLGGNACWKTPENQIKYLNGSKGTYTGWGPAPNLTFLVLENGMNIWFYWYSWIIVDINGDAAPNAWGKDIFTFYGSSTPIFPGNGTHPSSIGRNDSCTKLSSYTRAQIIAGGTNCLADASEGCNKTDTKGGVTCAALIIHDNFTIENDYPWN